MLDQIRIVLVQTSHPGNIGSVARAMKTMGLQHLYLVSPQSFPHPKADELSSGAQDVLDNSIVVTHLNEAIDDCGFVVGTSARERTIPWPIMSPREMAGEVKQITAGNQVAILFGREQSGLTNEELRQCHLHVQIPANQNYSSLNLAQAVQVISYEIRMASLIKEEMIYEWDYRLATQQELNHFFDHLKNVSIATGFLKPEAPRQLMTRLRRLFLRAKPDAMEINMLRGMLTAIEASLKTKV